MALQFLWLAGFLAWLDGWLAGWKGLLGLVAFWAYWFSRLPWVSVFVGWLGLLAILACWLVGWLGFLAGL
jgi:hypothetical protein